MCERVWICVRECIQGGAGAVIQPRVVLSSQHHGQYTFSVLYCSLNLKGSAANSYSLLLPRPPGCYLAILYRSYNIQGQYWSTNAVQFSRASGLGSTFDIVPQLQPTGALMSSQRCTVPARRA